MKKKENEKEAKPDTLIPVKQLPKSEELDSADTSSDDQPLSKGSSKSKRKRWKPEEPFDEWSVTWP